MTRDEAIKKIENNSEIDGMFDVPTIETDIAINTIIKIYDDFENREAELLKEIDELKGFKSGNSLPSRKLIIEMFNYVDGNLIWNIKRSGTKGIGSIAGSIYNDGYRNIIINGKRYSAHRIIWIYHNGHIKDGLEIDHIDGNRSNNHIENLRNISRQENSFNRTTSKGYCFDSTYEKYKAYIIVDGKGKHLGHFDTELEAEQAYLSAKNKYHKIATNMTCENCKYRGKEECSMLFNDSDYGIEDRTEDNSYCSEFERKTND